MWSGYIIIKKLRFFLNIVDMVAVRHSWLKRRRLVPLKVVLYRTFCTQCDGKAGWRVGKEWIPSY